MDKIKKSTIPTVQNPTSKNDPALSRIRSNKIFHDSEHTQSRTRNKAHIKHWLIRLIRYVGIFAETANR